MQAPTNLVAPEQVEFVGVHDRQRHVIRPTEQLHNYPDGGIWAFSLCHRAAYEPPEELVRAAKEWPMCEECISLVAEERAVAGS
jgi:hypothetical protein